MTNCWLAACYRKTKTAKPLARDRLQTPSGARILWLPKQFGNFSIELLEEAELERFVEEAFDGIGIGAEGRS